VSDQGEGLPIERRRANRVRSGPLRVVLDTGAVGTLVDLNEFGARIELPAPQEVNSRMAFDLHWEGVTVRLQGRVVRSMPYFDEEARLTWGEPASYHVALEFFDLAAECAITLHDVVWKLSRASLETPGSKAGQNDPLDRE
jgi:hypothetical protein